MIQEIFNVSYAFSRTQIDPIDEWPTKLHRRGWRNVLEGSHNPLSSCCWNFIKHDSLYVFPQKNLLNICMISSWPMKCRSAISSTRLITLDLKTCKVPISQKLKPFRTSFICQFYQYTTMYFSRKNMFSIWNMVAI